MAIPCTLHTFSLKDQCQASYISVQKDLNSAPSSLGCFPYTYKFVIFTFLILSFIFNIFLLI